MRKTIPTLFALAAVLGAIVQAGAQNPYLPLWEHLPDGEPRVFEDPDEPGKYRLYIFGSHDVRFAEYCGVDIRAWSAPVEDLGDWRDEGPIFSYTVDGQWDVMFAPDMVEVDRRDGTREYWLYPHSRGDGREAMVARGERPDGPFAPVNMTPDRRSTLPGSIMGFDPSVWIEPVDDPADPDYATGFRAWGFWGFQRSSAAELDPSTMWSVRPGTEVIPYFMPASSRYGDVRDHAGTTYPHLFPDEDPRDYNFFEASSIRRVGNKYLLIYSGYSGPEYGMESSNSTLRYAYGDTPLGPWRAGGVLVDSRAPVPNADGSALQATNGNHNTHGSIERVGDRWWVFYHRPPRGFGFARQAMVAPISVEWDEKPVSEGGRVTIRAFDPYSADGTWSARDTAGHEYTGAEVTSEGFQIYGLDPWRYYSAGYACYLSDVATQTDSWDIWADDAPIADVSNGHIIGYKYFGFGGLTSDRDGVKAFRGTHPGDGTTLNVWLTPRTDEAFKVGVWLDGPWNNDVWRGKKIGDIAVPADSTPEHGAPEHGAPEYGEHGEHGAPANAPQHFTLDVAAFVDRLDGKHSLWLVAEGGDGPLFDLAGLGFSSKTKPLSRPAAPTVQILIDGRTVDLPATPVRATHANGITGYDLYEAQVAIPRDTDASTIPVVTASATDPEVKITVTQPTAIPSEAQVRFDYRGTIKTYNLILK